jgi:regulator of sigma E protease
MDLISILRVAEVIFGIGLVIFVHEAGHFIAARLCGVRVEVFSLGFGPAILSRRRGETIYQLALIPFGGYVRMAGEGGSTGGTPKPDELGAKTVGQRFFVYSGGVLMNMIFALVAFPIAYRAGVPVTPAIISAPTPGGAAWQAGLPSGAELLEINGHHLRDFEDLIGEVALGGPDPAKVTYRDPRDGLLHETTMTPIMDPDLGFYRLGLGVGVDPAHTLRVEPDGPAELAGLQEGSILLEVQGQPAEQPLAVQIAWAIDSGKPLVLTVDQGQGPEQITIPAIFEDLPERLLFGLGPPRRLISQVRPQGPGQSIGLQAGDLLQRIGEENLVAGHDLLSALVTAPAASELIVERFGEALSLKLPDSQAQRAALFRDLYFEAQTNGNHVWVDPEGAAGLSGMPSGSEIVSIADTPISDWESIQLACSRAVERNQKATIQFRTPTSAADAEPESITIAPLAARMRVLGFDMARPTAIFQTTSLWTSVREGARSSWRFLFQTFKTLKRMISNDVSPKNLGGIITISRVSFHVSTMGWAKLLTFLCILSVNLAFLNVLPIPVLDGGHLFFLLIEKLKGSPVSARTLGYSQVVGLVLIVTLMVYVTYNDVLRLIAN